MSAFNLLCLYAGWMYTYIFYVILVIGRFFCSSCFTLAAMVFSRRVTVDSSLKEGKKFTYFIGDGRHGSFCVDGPPAKVLNKVMHE